MGFNWWLLEIPELEPPTFRTAFPEARAPTHLRASFSTAFQRAVNLETSSIPVASPRAGLIALDWILRVSYSLSGRARGTRLLETTPPGAS
jgi:hypothetical protein